MDSNEITLNKTNNDQKKIKEEGEEIVHPPVSLMISSGKNFEEVLQVAKVSKERNAIDQSAEKNPSKKPEPHRTKNIRGKSPKYSGIKHKIASLISEKTSQKILVPGFDGPLVSLSLFNELQHNILTTEEIENAYKDYKSKYESKKFHSFHVEHQHDEWFKEKYDPELNLKWKNEKNSQCQKLSQKFNESIPQLKNLSLELVESDEYSKNYKMVLYGYNRETDEFEEKEIDISTMTSKPAVDYTHCTIDISGAPYYGFDPDKLTLFVHQLPRNISRWQIVEVLKKAPGFISMSLSEPIKNQNYYRYCWFSFDTESNTDMAYEMLKDYKITADYKIYPIKSKSSTIKKIRVTPPLFEERIAEDLELTKALILMYDNDKSIESNSIFDGKELRSKEYQLDLQLLYLRRVHGFCYYCLEEHDDERMLATKCDNAHLKNYKRLGTRKNEANPDLNRYEVDWDKNFTRLVKQKLEKGIPSSKITLEGSEELNKKRNEYCKENTLSVSSERFQCNLCKKMFKGPNFVYNHIFNKHNSLIKENVDKEFFNKLKYDNYVKDPNKIYEKYKIISSMEEYLHYLNTVQNFQFHETTLKSKPQHYSRYKDSRDISQRKRKHGKDYKDLDDPEIASSHPASGTTRQLISYDDL